MNNIHHNPRFHTTIIEQSNRSSTHPPHQPHNDPLPPVRVLVQHPADTVTINNLLPLPFPYPTPTLPLPLPQRYQSTSPPHPPSAPPSYHRPLPIIPPTPAPNIPPQPLPLPLSQQKPSLQIPTLIRPDTAALQSGIDKPGRRIDSEPDTSVRPAVRPTAQQPFAGTI